MNPDLLLMKLDELLAEVEVRRIRAVVYRKALQVNQFISYLHGLMHHGIIIEENEGSVVLSTQSLHPIYHIW
jgi:predicted transcriptional regulator